MSLQPRRLGNSDLVISPLGIGTWAMGGDWQFGWGPQNDDDSVSAILRAVELGANWLDTAPAYGFGHAEHVVGRAIAELGSERPFVFTKCGMVWDEKGKVTKCLSTSSVRKECESSLTRLRLEAIDLLQTHWPTGNPDELLEAWEEMTKLKGEGKVRYLGACNLGAEDLARLEQIQHVTSLQRSYSLVDSSVSGEDLNFAKSHGIGLLAYSPLGSGLLTNKFVSSDLSELAENDWRRKSPKFKGPELEARREIALRAAITGRAQEREATLIETALGYVLADHRFCAAIVGIRSKTQASENFGRLDAIERMSREFSVRRSAAVLNPEAR